MIQFDQEICDHHRLLFEWFAEFANTPEWDHCFYGRPDYATFFRMFDKGNLYFEVERDRIVLAFWVTQCYDGLAIGVWTHPKRRQGDLQIEAILAIAAAVKSAPFVVVSTCQASVCRLAEGLGFEYAGKLDGAWYGENVIMYRTDKEHFNPERMIEVFDGQRRRLGKQPGQQRAKRDGHEHVPGIKPNDKNSSKSDSRGSANGRRRRTDTDDKHRRDSRKHRAK